MDTPNEDISRFRAATGAIVAVVAGLFLLYVYGYPRIFPGIERSQPDQFEAAIAAATAAGRADHALKIAQRAAEARPFDPLAFTAWGRVLAAQGDMDGAFEQLGKAVAITENEPGATIRETRLPFYCTPARLTWGRLCLEQGRLPEAVYHFDLARGGGDLADTGYGEFSAALRDAYARQGFWARSLEFGEPGDAELSGLDAASTARLARVAEGRRDWALVTKLAERLLAEDAYFGEAHYLLGRSCLGQRQYETAATHLEQAASKEHPGAAFYLGVTYERANLLPKAFDAYLRVPRSDLFAPLAPICACSLWKHLPEDSPERKRLSSSAAVMERFEQALARMEAAETPIERDTSSSLAPVALTYSEAHYASGGRFPVVILREDARRDREANGSFTVSGDAEISLTVRYGNRVLQYQWTENELDWDGVRCLPEGTDTVAGWIDTAREWFNLRPDSVAHVAKDAEGRALLSIDKLTWYYSVPFVPKPGADYLLAGHVQGEAGAGCLSWQAFDRRERVDAEGSTKSSERGDATWQACHVQVQPQWERMRVQLATTPNAGPVLFRDVMMIPIDEPSLPKD